MMLFIHGFGSCGWGEKSLQLRRHFGVERVIAPDLPFHPARAIAHLQDLIARYPVATLIGSSLGGFYATWLTGRYRLPAILINPAVRPYELLADFIGTHRRWCDQAPFEVDESHLTALVDLHREQLDTAERYLVLLQQGDEVLDYRLAADYYRGKDLVSVPGGNHRFEDFAAQLPRIDAWLAAQDRH